MIDNERRINRFQRPFSNDPITVYSLCHNIISLSETSLICNPIERHFNWAWRTVCLNFIGAGGISTIAALVTIFSLVVPATLPFIIYVFFEDTEEFVIPIYDISFLLVTALFIPLSLGWSTRRYVPRISKLVAGNSLFLSVIFIMLINFSMFARFSQYFFIDQSLVLTSMISASLLFVIYLIVGYLLALSIKEQLIATRINGIIAMTYINNILVFVVAERFFDIETAALAAFYNIPYYAGLLILRVKYSRRRNQESK